MNFQDLLIALRQRNITIRFVDDRLQVSSDESVPENLLKTLKLYKKELEDVARRSSHEDRIVGSPLDTTETFALSGSQRRIWILSQMPEANNAYNIFCEYVISGEMDFDLLEKSVNGAIIRHEILRTQFITDVQGTPRQQVLDASRVYLPIELIDYSGTTSAEKFLNEVRDRVLQTQFQLDKWPLCHFEILKVSAKQSHLFFCIHHIISDGLSSDILLNEILSDYSSRKTSQQARHEPLKFQFRDFVNWQETVLMKGGLDKSRNFWKNLFAGELDFVTIPADLSRPPIKSYRGDTLRYVFPEDFLKRLTSFATQANTTLFITLLSSLKSLLYRYTGKTDLIVGTVVSGRNHTDLQNQIGFYANTLALRSNIQPQQSFESLVQSMRQSVLDAFSFQDYSLDQLVDDLQIDRSNDRGPLFEIMFVLHETSTSPRRFHDGIIIPSSRKSPVSKFDITFNFIVQDNQTLALELEYCTDLFKRHTAERIVTNFEIIVREALLKPETPINKLNYLSIREKEQIAAFNNTALTLPHQTVVDIFEQQALRYGNRVILHCEQRSFTYEQLNRKANQIAFRMATDFDIKPGTVVAIVLNRSEWLPVIYFALLKSGATYIPIDPVFPAERIDFILDDAGCRYVIVDDQSHVTREGIQLISISALEQNLQTYPSSNPGRTILPTDAAYVIYTSGSTGTPKGVEVSHENLLNFSLGMSQGLSLTSSDHILAITSISFDISFLELIWSLCVGIELTIHTSRPQLGGFIKILPPATLDFSLFYFSNQENAGDTDKYNFVLETSKYADESGYSALWIPERHFHEFGGIFPNPAILGAALASITKKISIRSGSVVLPLHDPIRVAEDWAVVDNLSGGRVELSISSGWHADDFVFFPEDYTHRQERMYQQIEEVTCLWRGGTVQRRNGKDRDITVKVFPKPLQAELPLWITSGGSEETFRSAGKLGAGILTHFLGQSLDDLKKNISIYKRSLIAHGHPIEKAKIALMLHTYIGQDLEVVKSEVKVPFKNYLKTSYGLIEKLRTEIHGTGSLNMNGTLNPIELDEILEIAFERYWNSSALIGTPQTCSLMLQAVHAAGVTEIACLADFGMPHEKIKNSLALLTTLKSNFQGQKNTFANRKDTEHNRAVNTLQTTPSLVKLLLQDKDSTRFLTSLDTIIIGGEQLEETLMNSLRNSTHANIFNVYGPTETTIWSTLKNLTTQKEVSAGRPIANTQVYILDNDDRIASYGIPGEICIGGKGVSHGYYNNPVLTKKKFVSDIPGHEGILYRTGDVGKWLPDGDLLILGRKDNQVKVGGHRVELGEIESVLMKCRDIEAAAVILSGEILKAYVVSGAEIKVNEVRKALAKKLPEYMIPAQIIQLEELPLNSNGKVNRNSLASLTVKPNDFSLSQEPRNSTEAQLATIFQTALSRNTVGISDNFFSIGGNSLAAIRLIGLIKETFNVAISLRDFFQGPSVESLAALIADSGPRENEWIIPQATAMSHYPVSNAQYRIWMFSKYEQDTSIYNDVPEIYRIDSSLDLDAFRVAFNKVITRHEVLRTRIAEINGEPRQVIEDADGRYSLQVIDLGEEENSNNVLEFIVTKSKTGLSIFNPPLFHALLVKLNDERYFFGLTLHHIISDGFSKNIFLRDLLAFYQQRVNGYSTLSLPPLRMQFKDYAAWHNGILSSSEIKTHKEFWSRQFARGIPPLRLPVDYPRPAFKTYEASSISAVINREQVTELKKLSQDNSATLFMSVLSLTRILLADFCSQNDVVVGSPVTGRDSKELNDQIGCYVNMMVSYVQVNPQHSYSTHLKEERTSLIDVFEHQRYPFDLIVSEFAQQRNLGRHPVFDVIVNFNEQNNELSEAIAHSSLQVELQKTKTSRIKVDLVFSFNIQTDGNMKIDFQFNTDLFQETTIAVLAEKMRRLIDQVLQDPFIPIGKLNLEITRQAISLKDDFE